MRWLHDTPIAHRGLHSGHLPENSLAAFEAAVVAGYAIELDVRCSRDGRLVVHHDADTARLTGRAHLVAETDAAVLTTLRLGGTGQRIPLLADVLAMVAGRVPVLIEIKSGTPMSRLGPALLATLAGYRGRFAVQSFDPGVLAWVRRHAPDYPRGQVCGSFAGLPRARRALRRAMVTNLRTRPAFLAFDVRAMPSPAVRFWRWVLGAPVLAWTVRTGTDLRRAARSRANIIFENLRPASPSARC
jgi:glycerophosphoryl diester phosphodiesterase